MRRLATLGVAVLGLILIASTPAFAANAHFKHGSPTFTDKGVILNASGSLAGLGNGDIVVTVTATGQPTSTCTNPAGGTQPPGQNPAEVVLTGVEAIPGSDIKNGNVAFSVDTAAPVSPIPGAPDCPNKQWTEDITDVAFSSATITVYQPCTDTTPPIDCPIVLQQTFTL